MSNQVNQESFESWLLKIDQGDQEILEAYELAQFAWQAATQDSEQRIKELEEIIESQSLVICDKEKELGLMQLVIEHKNIDIYELQADNLRLREALERIVKADDNVYNCEDDYQGDVIGKLSDIHFKAYNKARKVLSSTPTQSLASHDNEVIERCKNIVANDALAITFQSMGAYRSAIIKQIGELKAEHD